MCENDVEGVKRSLNSFNCYSCYCTHVERVESGVCGLCTQYRYIQCYVERIEKALTVLIVTHVTHVESGVCDLFTQYRYIQCYVERVKRVERLCYVETRDKHIFAHNFLNIQAIFNLKKVLESWDLDLSNHTIQYHVCRRGQKLLRLSTPLTCFDIHCIGWYGWKGLSLSFPKLFLDWKLLEY